MDATAELGRNPVSKHEIQPDYGDEQADAGRDCRTRLARPNSQARTNVDREININFPCSTDHEQDWQPYPVYPYSCYMCVTMHTCMRPESDTQLGFNCWCPFLFCFIFFFFEMPFFWECVCVFFPFILDIKFVGRTSWGHPGGRSHRISHPPSFWGACLNFSREKDSAIPFPRRP